MKSVKLHIQRDMRMPKQQDVRAADARRRQNRVRSRFDMINMSVRHKNPFPLDDELVPQQRMRGEITVPADRPHRNLRKAAQQKTAILVMIAQMQDQVGICPRHGKAERLRVPMRIGEYNHPHYSHLNAFSEYTGLDNMERVVFMADHFNKSANELLHSPQGAKINAKKDELESIVNSAEGQKVKQMLDGKTDSLIDAFEKGDMATLSNSLSAILGTKEGAQLAEKLMDMLK